MINNQKKDDHLEWKIENTKRKNDSIMENISKCSNEPHDKYFISLDRQAKQKTKFRTFRYYK